MGKAPRLVEAFLWDILRQCYPPAFPPHFAHASESRTRSEVAPRMHLLSWCYDSHSRIPRVLEDLNS
jgi:hypothetical protein